jgi:FG-GAP repeat
MRWQLRRVIASPLATSSTRKTVGRAAERRRVWTGGRWSCNIGAVRVRLVSPLLAVAAVAAVAVGVTRGDTASAARGMRPWPVGGGSPQSRINPGADFNGDGFADLAVGVPFEDVVPFKTVVENAGAVQVIYGSIDGLNGDAPIDDQFWSKVELSDSTTIPSTTLIDKDDHFGAALAAGDFNNDGFDDLAIGIPNEDVQIGPYRGVHDAGAVYVLRGSSTGLRPGGFFTQASRGMHGRPKAMTISDSRSPPVTSAGGSGTTWQLECRTKTPTSLWAAGPWM